MMFGDFAGAAAKPERTVAISIPQLAAQSDRGVSWNGFHSRRNGFCLNQKGGCSFQFRAGSSRSDSKFDHGSTTTTPIRPKARGSVWPLACIHCFISPGARLRNRPGFAPLPLAGASETSRSGGGKSGN